MAEKLPRKYSQKWPSNKKKFFMYLEEDLRDALIDMASIYCLNRHGKPNVSEMARIALREGLLAYQRRKVAEAQQ